MKKISIMLRSAHLLISLILVLMTGMANAQINPYQYTINKMANGNKGAVSSAHPLASQVGLEILKKGGNAFDAAIATQLALAVVYPGAGNIGGGGFLVAYTNKGKAISIDYREKAPGSASRDMYLDKDGNPLLNLSQNGHLASGVPGTVAGLFASHKYGKLGFASLIQPAIELAEKGFVITAAEARSLNGSKSAFEKYNTVRPAFVKENTWKAGDTLVQKDLAATLSRIRDNGMKGFYEGETARLITAEMKRGGGKISLEDLKNYTAAERDPIIFDYKGHTVIGMPMPSSGGLLMQQMMKMIEDRDIASMGFHSSAAVQLMIEVERRAYADRAEFMGDKDFVKVPVKTLSSDSYLKERMKDFIPGKATPSDMVKPGKANPESDETTHLSVADQYGNVVSVTTTLNGGYGSKTVVGGAGFLLNNEMDDFSVKPGVPNMFGAVGKEANAIAPGKRMLSSMTPTVVLKDKKPWLVVGTPGGTTIPTSVFQTLVNIIDFKQSSLDAVNNPKFHHQWLPDQVMVENDFPKSLQSSLEKMGYLFTNRGQIGRTEVIKLEWSGKKLRSIEAVADKRGDDHAAAY
ncbi:MAG: gamma-glutamyltransferase [Chitinophagaceae bacterium]|nr:gamma-glutamyltransferase [Chitinophagaceae bacterium]